MTPDLTPEEAEVARRYFAGEVRIEELRPVIEAHLQRLIAAGVIQNLKERKGAP